MEAPRRAPANRNYAFCTALFEELERAGLTHICICPGSRSAPLAIAAARTSGLRCWSWIDERSAGFFALGIAKAQREPVGVVCTSGSAAANLLPAVCEAHYARLPLLLLTADRPPELRDWGAGQTIDQGRLYGSHVRWACDVALPWGEAQGLRYARALAARAVALCRGGAAGPVHLNFPLREPLAPLPETAGAEASTGASWPDDALARDGRPGGQPYTRHRWGGMGARDATAQLVDWVADHPRGIIACGPLDAEPALAAAIARLGAAASWPIVAEATSGLRFGPARALGPILDHGELWLRAEDFSTRWAPEVVLRIGPPLTSAAFRDWLERHPPLHTVAVETTDAWNDPSHQNSELWHVDPELLCRTAAQRLSTVAPNGEAEPWCDAFRRADRAAARALGETLGEPLLTAGAARALTAELSAVEHARQATTGSGGDAQPLLYVANSMPVRGVDAFCPGGPEPLRVLANRGTAGIDGNVSSALGAGAVPPRPAVLLCGDLALLHDAGGLLAARRNGLSLAIVVLNNGGGGIFEFLPVASACEASVFEEFFLTPPELDIAALARAAGASYCSVDSSAALRRTLRTAVVERSDPGALTVIEVPLHRESDRAEHAALAAAVCDAVEGDATP